MAGVASIKPISETDVRHARIMIHGDAGIGKTTLAASAPNCLILANNSEQGVGPARRGIKADQWVVRDYTDMEEAMDWLKHSRENKYDWIIWDNASLFQEQGMLMIMDDLVAANPSRNLYIPDKPQYLLSQQRMYRIMTDLDGLPMNVIVVAHSMLMETQDEEGKDVEKIVPMFQGGKGVFSEKLCGMVSSIWYLHMKRMRKDGEPIDVRYLTVERGGLGLVHVKDGYGVGNMPEPTMPKLISKMSLPEGRTGTPRKASAAKKTAGARKAPAKKAVAKKAAPAKKAAAGRR